MMLPFAINSGIKNTFATLWSLFSQFPGAVGTEGCSFAAEGGPCYSIQEKLCYVLGSSGENHGHFWAQEFNWNLLCD